MRICCVQSRNIALPTLVANMMLSSLHDRKLCIIGLMILVTMQPRPQVLANLELTNQILPACILLFDGLKRSYAARAEREKKAEDEEDSDEESIEGGGFLHLWIS